MRTSMLTHAMGCPLTTLRNVEQSNDPLRKVAEFMQRRGYRLSGQRASVAERYLDSDLNVVVRVGRFARESVALIRRAAPQEIVQLRICPELVDADSVRRRVGVHQGSMFPGDVHIMEGPEKGRNIPSIVWLETFDRVLIGSGQPLYFFSSKALKLLGGKTDGEIDIFFADVSVSLGEFAGEQIETAARAVDDSSGLGVNYFRKGLDLINLPNVIAGLRIFLSADGVWATVDPAINPFAENIELGFGPLNTRERV